MTAENTQHPILSLPTDFVPSGCSFTNNDWSILARHWYPVAIAADILDTPVGVTLLDLDLVVFRTSHGVHVGWDRCPHRGTPLSMGSVSQDELVCPYHGLRFATNGECTLIPSQPNYKPSKRYAATLFPTVERYGLVWTCLLPGGDARIPPMPGWEDSEFQRILPPYVDIGGSAGRQVEGFVDVAHFAFVHHNAFADPDNSIVPKYETNRTDLGLRMEYFSTVSNFPKRFTHLAPPDFNWLRVYEIYPPFCARLTVHFPNNGLLHILNAASPISACKTRLFVPILRNFDKTGSIEEVLAFNEQVFAEDRALVERQRPTQLPLTISAEAHFAADKMSVEYRRLLREMGLGT